MNTQIIVVCRMDSSRLPGKTLAMVSGKPLLGYVLERCRLVNGADLLSVATSRRTVDDPIAEYCARAGLHCFRGSTDDVAGRVLGCARESGADCFLRVNGDSPFLPPDLLDTAVAMAAGGGYDLVTNLSPRSYPYGVSVELVRTRTFERLYPAIRGTPDAEHVTRYLYGHLDLLSFHNLRYSGGDLSDCRMTVDTPDDLNWFEDVVRRLGEAWREAGFEQVLQLSPRCK